MPARLLRWSLPFVLLLAPWLAAAQEESGAEALRAQYKTMTPGLASNPFHRKLVLQSDEGSGKLSGNIYAVVDHPFGDVASAFKLPATWCGVLMLHLNTKYCAVQGSGASPTLNVAVGRKFDQPVADASQVNFVYTLKAATGDYLDVNLNAASGPMSTRDYRIVLEATPIDASTTFIHLGYSYGYGTAARIAMQAYLGTIGSDKVGFTATGKGGKGAPDYIGGVRGVVERNTMRYYLAIDAYLDAPSPQQQEQRTAAWFDATEQYALQLHEMSKDDYLAMKRNEYRRLTARQ
ncbi:MAG: hypothetical protein JWQ73_1720 [Variovorax sp.]|nr:hypothetical protein [Variovorax sp.]